MLQVQRSYGCAFAMAAWLICLPSAAGDAGNKSALTMPSFVPWPQKIESRDEDCEWNIHTGWQKKDGSPNDPAIRKNLEACTLKSTARIVAAVPELEPLTHVLSREAKSLFKREFPIGRASDGRDTDVVLKIDPALAAEEYVLAVGDGVTITGGTYAATAMGTVTFLQAASTADDGELQVPKMIVRDSPAAGYRGLMVDVARNWHSIDTLKQCVVLCRLYKVNMLQLHLSDTSAFMFPSTAFPKLGSPWGPEKRYTREQLRHLVEFARDRGVQVIPEIECPGHAARLMHDMPEVFCCDPARPNNHTICVGREEVYESLATLVGEVAEVFDTTPYFHIGADETNTACWQECRHCKAYMAAKGIPDADELYRHFLVRMNEIVRKHGRKTIAWEGFRKTGKTPIPKDMTVMVYESLFNTGTDLVADGYPIINASWKPLYVVSGLDIGWPPQDIYSSWNIYTFLHWIEKSKAYSEKIVVSPSPLVLGGQMCIWEQGEQDAIRSVRRRLPAMAERIWIPRPDLHSVFFDSRLHGTNRMLTPLLETATHNP